MQWVLVVKAKMKMQELIPTLREEATAWSQKIVPTGEETFSKVRALGLPVLIVVKSGRSSFPNRSPEGGSYGLYAVFLLSSLGSGGVL